MNLFEQVIDTIHCCAAALERADADGVEKRASAEKRAQALPEAVHACIKFGLVDESERPALEAALNDHAQCMHFVTKLAEHFGEQAAQAPVQALGSSVKQAELDRKNGVVPGSLGSSYVGAKTSRLKDSDLAYYRALGLNVPPNNDGF